MSPRATGSCLCGAVGFQVDGGFDAFFLCHCSRCRKGTGSAHGANLFASNATLTWTEGEANVRHYALPGTRHARSFCATCGSALPMAQFDGALIVVPAGNLDTLVETRPTARICLSDRAAWTENLDAVPGFPGLPGQT
ncbi:MAG: GFA family protein [Micropepsaceae bacterium]